MSSSVPATPTNGTYPSGEHGAAKSGFIPLVSVVDFHHARGPEVERWFGVPDGYDPATEYDWGLLPFMALSDGAHAATEDFSYFTLLRPAVEATKTPATSLFGISCTRQLDASQLLNRPAEVTRSTVQKAVVVIADSPQYFGMLRERLSVVTKAWFAQREFTDTEILRRFQESLADEKERGVLNDDEDRDQYLGMSLRELVREFKWQTLVLLKCCLLQPKMLFFGSRCERLCMMQFSLISLIPGLLRNLQDSAGPELDNYEKKLSRPTSLRTSDRNSLLSYMGLPLQIFGKGSLFGPYTPLQQLDVLADFGTKSYIVGSTNSLLLQQKDRYSDILINLDEDTINVTSTSLKAALQLSVADRRWIDFITQNVNDTWDETNPGRPKTMGYVGSEEFIRLQFEEYLLSLISSVKYHSHLAKHANNPKMLLPHIEGDPSHDFGLDFVEAWARTENYRIWDSHTDSHLFDIVEPKHPCAGGLTIDDVQRRITQQVQELHLDERFAQGKEVLGRNLAAGREKASTMFNRLYADMEALREAQRRRAEEAKAASEKNGGGGNGVNGGGGGQNGGDAALAAAVPAVDLAKAQQTMQAVSTKAGAFVSSWTAWAGEKRKAAGWGRSSAAAAVAAVAASSSGNGNSGGDTKASAADGGNGGGGGWTSGWGKGNKNRASYASTIGGGSGGGSEENQPLGRSIHRSSQLISSSSSSASAGQGGGPSDRYEQLPVSHRDSFSGESILNDGGSESGLSSLPGSPQRVRKRPVSGAGAAVPAATTPLVTIDSVVAPSSATTAPAAAEKTDETVARNGITGAAAGGTTGTSTGAVAVEQATGPGSHKENDAVGGGEAVLSPSTSSTPTAAANAEQPISRPDTPPLVMVAAASAWER
ncbi:transport protein Avl9-domain-containing protein [Bombardia bombarda]|uniref:Transport protein Avl9-domain-containing protein n=1 Tax=Bombardia bombarda TaxID=252184 RepID=A0AA39XAE4_9PEZI|nr:transport protein Avl9-domain-containing protein [Bombardia bombarda]